MVNEHNRAVSCSYHYMYHAYYILSTCYYVLLTIAAAHIVVGVLRRDVSVGYIILYTYINIYIASKPNYIIYMCVYLWARNKNCRIRSRLILYFRVCYNIILYLHTMGPSSVVCIEYDFNSNNNDNTRAHDNINYIICITNIIHNSIQGDFFFKPPFSQSINIFER